MATLIKVKERPILFSTPMVKAILEGRKTVTRRVISDKYIINQEPDRYRHHGQNNLGFAALFEDLRPEITPWISPIPCPYGTEPGDVLWVRETWSKIHYEGVDENPTYIFKADWTGDAVKGIWKPSIHMPRAACRLRLEIVSITVERLQDITEEDAIREGIEPLFRLEKDFVKGDQIYRHYTDPTLDGAYPVPSFASLWKSINGAESWNANPWVWRIEFKRTEL